MNEDKSTRYHRLRRRADLLGTAAAGLVLLALLASGAGSRMREWAAAVSSFIPGGFDDAMTVALYAVMLIVLLQLVELPFAFYQGFLLEHRYGLSTQTGRHWLSDQAKGVMLGAGAHHPRRVGCVPDAARVARLVVAGLGRDLRGRPWSAWRGSRRWCSCRSSTASSRSIVPRSSQRLLGLARKARTDVVGVFEWVLSGHTRKANAALAGMGTDAPHPAV